MGFVKQMRLLFLAGVLLSCNSAPTIVDSTLVEQTETISPPTSLPQIANPSKTSESIAKNCHAFEQVLSVDESINGKLLFGNVNAIRFPDVMKVPFISDENKLFADPAVSFDGNFLATHTSLYDTAGNYLEETLDVYSSNGNVVVSIPWKGELWTSIIGWVEDELVVQTSQANSLVILNPFLGTSRDITLDHNISEEISIIAYDPLLQYVAYYYPSDPGTKIRMIIWDLVGQQEIWSTQDLYYPMISDVAWSYAGSKIAISTLPINELQSHSEIFIVETNGNSTQVSNFRESFQQIQIVDIHWSLDNTKIFFWAWTRDKNESTGSNYDLYAFDLKTGVVTQYCITGDSHNNNIVWLVDYPGYFVTNSYTVYDSHNGVYKWDVLLVNIENNSVYKIGEDFSSFGWLKLP